MTEMKRELKKLQVPPRPVDAMSSLHFAIPLV